MSTELSRFIDVIRPRLANFPKTTDQEKLLAENIIQCFDFIVECQQKKVRYSREFEETFMDVCKRTLIDLLKFIDPEESFRLEETMNVQLIRMPTSACKEKDLWYQIAGRLVFFCIEMESLFDAIKTELKEK